MTETLDADFDFHALATEAVTSFSDALADVYDLVYPPTPDLDALGDLLETLAGPGASVLEHGIGTGRVGLTLAERGFAVHGVDTATKMLERLAEKDTEGLITTTQGDFTTLELGRTFDVVLAPFNVLLCAVMAEQQIATLAAAKRHLAPGGHVVVETFDPSDYHTLKRSETNTHVVGDRGVLFESISVAPASQHMMVVNTLMVDGLPPKADTLLMRYLWPSELDLIAGIVGLELTERFGGWSREPFTGGDGRAMCVSVYQVAE